MCLSLYKNRGGKHTNVKNLSVKTDFNKRKKYETSEDDNKKMINVPYM